MFDISFFELLIVLIVGLVVIGPERLPETVRSVSLWIGRFKRSLRETRSELEKQLGADDIRRQLHNEDVMQSLAKTRREIESAMQDSHKAITDAKADIEHHATLIEEDLPDHAHMDDPTHPANAQVTAPADAAETVAAPTEPKSHV